MSDYQIGIYPDGRISDLPCDKCSYDFPQRCQCGGVIHEHLIAKLKPYDPFIAYTEDDTNNFDDIEEDGVDIRRIYQIQCDTCLKFY